MPVSRLARAVFFGIFYGVAASFRIAGAVRHKPLQLGASLA